MIAWRITKTRYQPYDGTGARERGGRWNSPGHPVVYASDSFAGAVLEILAHSLRPRTLPGAHHGVRIDIPAELVEEVNPAGVPGWMEKDSPAARMFGDRWIKEGRTAALAVPALPTRPIGRTLMINPDHPDAARIDVSLPFAVAWDERLF